LVNGYPLGSVGRVRSAFQSVPAGRDRLFDQGLVQHDKLKNVIPADIDQRPEGQGAQDRQRQILENPLARASSNSLSTISLSRLPRILARRLSTPKGEL